MPDSTQQRPLPLHKKIIHVGVIPQVLNEGEAGAAPAFINPASGELDVFMLSPAGLLELGFQLMMEAQVEMLTDEARQDLTRRLTGGIILPTGADMPTNGRPQ